MKEVLRTTDPVLISYLLSMFEGEDIEAVVLDVHTSSAFTGSIGALPRRMMVRDTDFDRARRLIAETEANG